MPISQTDWDLFVNGLVSAAADAQQQVTDSQALLTVLRANWDTLHDFGNLQQTLNTQEIARLRQEQTSNANDRSRIEARLRALGANP